MFAIDQRLTIWDHSSGSCIVCLIAVRFTQFYLSCPKHRDINPTCVFFGLLENTKNRGNTHVPSVYLLHSNDFLHELNVWIELFVTIQNTDAVSIHVQDHIFLVCPKSFLSLFVVLSALYSLFPKNRTWRTFKSITSALLDTIWSAGASGKSHMERDSERSAEELGRRSWRLSVDVTIWPWERQPNAEPVDLYWGLVHTYL